MSSTVTHVASQSTATRSWASWLSTIEHHDGLSFYLSWLIGFFVFTLIPIVVASLWLAFTDYNILSTPNWIGATEFRANVERSALLERRAGNLFLCVYVGSTPADFALAVALLMNGAYRLVGVYRAVYYVPSLVGGSVAVAIMWRQIFGDEGVINLGLSMLGINGAELARQARARFSTDYSACCVAVWLAHH